MFISYEISEEINGAIETNSELGELKGCYYSYYLMAAVISLKGVASVCKLMPVEQYERLHYDIKSSLLRGDKVHSLNGRWYNSEDFEEESELKRFENKVESKNK